VQHLLSALSDLPHKTDYLSYVRALVHLVYSGRHRVWKLSITRANKLAGHITHIVWTLPRIQAYNSE